MKEVLRQWNLESMTYEKLSDTVWLLDDRSMLKRYTNPYVMKNNIGILKAMKKANVPVPELLQTPDREDFILYEDIYYIITKQIEGGHLPVEDVVKDHQVSYDLGVLIAGLHEALKASEEEYTFNERNLVEEMNGWVRQRIKNSGKNTYAYEVMDECINGLALVYSKLPRQPIHRDPHLGNMVFSEGKLTGFLDFDITQVNARLFDLAYMATGILSEIIDEIPLQLRWMDFVDRFIAGYEATSELTVIEKNNLYLMMACIEMLFVAYYLEKGDEQKTKEADRLLKWLVATGRVFSR